MSAEVLFLTQMMNRGFGVSVVVDALSRELISRRIPVAVGCAESDGSFAANYPVHQIEATPQAIDALTAETGAKTVIAHTSPWFELLPETGHNALRWAWEHGDPSPDLFPFDAEERRNICARKRHSVYPQLDRVIAISEFIRSDIQWPEATVIRNGCDHIVPASVTKRSGGPFRVGTLMRMGSGEAHYKGNQLFLELVQQLQCPDICFHLMGRGTQEDAQPFRDAGIEVHLNASDEERSVYLAELDIFVSMSLWEGFNLPLVEAAISGALPFALDIGAHPEVTPFVFSGVPEMAASIRTLAQLPGDLVRQRAEQTRRWCSKTFSWKAAADQLAELLP